MSHVHYWKIEPANGPTSQGTCECGESRDFRNSLPIDWARHQNAYRLQVNFDEVKRRKEKAR